MLPHLRVETIRPKFDELNSMRGRSSPPDKMTALPLVVFFHVRDFDHNVILQPHSNANFSPGALGRMGTLGTAYYIGATSDGVECTYCSSHGGEITNFRDASFTALSLACEVRRCIASGPKFYTMSYQ